MFIILLDLILYCAVLYMFTVYANKHMDESYFPAVKYGKIFLNLKDIVLCTLKWVSQQLFFWL